MLRDHQPIVIEEFNGLWSRGDEDSCPPDHSPDLNNVQFIQSGIRTRDGLDTYAAYDKPLRIYTFVSTLGEGILILTEGGHIFYTLSGTPFSSILDIPGMTDFGFVAINNRAYITPSNGLAGLLNEVIYVYDPTIAGGARKAGGAPPTGTLTLANGAAGHVEPGFHVFGVAYETNTGYITQIAGFADINVPADETVNITNIPVSPDAFVVARWIVATKAIDPTLYTGNLQGYQFFFLPGGRIADNTTTTFNASFYDAELLSDASHLLDLYVNIPAGVGLAVYHNRLISYGERANISLARISYPGEPEAVDKVSGILIMPLDGHVITNAQEFRDVLYMFKQTRTGAFTDNGDVPTSWPFLWVDQGIGAAVHGVSAVLDSGGVNIDYLLIIDISGTMLFNGSYIRPELSWKIRDYWLTLPSIKGISVQILNDSIQQFIYITLGNAMIYADYSNGLNAKDIRWAKWTFDVPATSITLVEYNKLIIAADQLASI